MRNFVLHVPTTIKECQDGHINVYPQNEHNDSKEALDTAINLCINDPFRFNEAERANKFLLNVAAKVLADHCIEQMYLFRLSLDDWEPFMILLQQAEQTNLETLRLSHCHFSERGAQTLANVLDTTTDKTNGNDLAFSIKTLYMKETTGNMTWMNGFLQNQSITHLYLVNMPMMYNAIHFIQKSPQLNKVTLLELTCEQDKTIRNKIIQFSGSNINQNQGENETSLETLEIVFREKEKCPLIMCQGIGHVLRSANKMKELKLKNMEQLRLSHNFLRDAIHCQKLDLFHSDFNTRALSFLVQGNGSNNDIDGNNDGIGEEGGGNLKELQICFPTEIQRVEELLQLLDLSRLDSFTLAHEHLCKSTALCQQLANNKGPQRLKLSFDSIDLNEFTHQMASSLAGNDKIQTLEIYSSSMGGSTFEPQERLVHVLCAAMPRLKRWRIKTRNTVFLCPKGRDIWNDWILGHLQSNPNLRQIILPFGELRKDVKEMLVYNKWRKLFCCHDQLSSGVWSRALSQIQTVRLMYRVLGQVPDLFRQVADDAASKGKPPRFSVPHSFDCPACHKQKRRASE